MTKGNGNHDPNVTSLDEARRQRADQEREANRAARTASGGTFGQRVFGIVMVAMAIGFVAWLLGAFGGTSAPVEVKE